MGVAAAAASDEYDGDGDGGEGGAEHQTRSAEEPAEQRVWSDEEWRAWNQWWEGQGWYSRPGDSGAQGTQDPLQQNDPWQRRETGLGVSSAAAASNEHWKDKEWWKKGDFSEPPSWAGWGHYRLWRRSLLRWDSNTDVSMHRRAEKVLKGLDWTLQERLDHISEERLASPCYLQEILYVLDILAGEKETSERRRTVRAALYEGTRKPEESLAEYSLRREAQFQSASQFLPLSDELKAFMMEEQAGLSKQSLQNLRVLTEGKREFARVKKALQIIDTEEEPLVKANKSSFLGCGLGEEMEPESDEEDYVNNLLEVIEQKDLAEDQAMSFLTTWNAAGTEEEAMSFLMEHGGGGKNSRRSWSENKLLKAARKKDRRHFEDRSSRARKPNSHRRLPIEELKKVTRCSNCGDKGHWREDCRQPYRSKVEREKREKETSAFVFLGASSSSASYGANWSAFAFFDKPKEKEVWSFFDIPAGHAIIDPGAAQDLIGWKKFQELEDRLHQSGLCPVILKETPPGASGIGGDAVPKFNALIPCMLGGYPGIVKITVVEQDIPQLLSIGLLEHAGAIINTKKDVIDFDNLETSCKMCRLPSGHRIIDIADWKKDEPFPVPSQLLKQYDLSVDAFDWPKRGHKEPASAEAVYMAESRVVSIQKYLQDITQDSLIDSWNIDCLGNPVFFSSCSSILEHALRERPFLQIESEWSCSAWIETKPETFECLHILMSVDRKDWKSCVHEGKPGRAVHVFLRNDAGDKKIHHIARASAEISVPKVTKPSHLPSPNHGVSSPSSRSKRAGSGCGSGILVSADLEATTAVSGGGQRSFGWEHARRDTSVNPTPSQVSSPSDIREERSESTRDLGSMRGMLHQAQLPSLLGDASTTSFEEEEGNSGALPASECGGIPTSSELEQCTNGQRRHGERPGEPGDDDFSVNSECRVSGNAAYDGSHAECHRRSTGVESAASRVSKTLPEAAANQLESRGNSGIYGDGEPRGRGLGERGQPPALWSELSSSVRSFTSLDAFKHVPLKCTESVGWFACKLQPHNLKHVLLDQNNNQAFLVQEDQGLSLCFFNSVLGDRLNNEGFSDREVQISRTVKRDMAASAQSLLSSKEAFEACPELELFHLLGAQKANYQFNFEASSESEKLRVNKESLDQETASQVDKARTTRKDGTTNSEESQDQQTASQVDKAKTTKGERRDDRIREEDREEKREDETTSSEELPPRLVSVLLENHRRHGSADYKIMELFSPPRVTVEAAKQGVKTTTPASFDLSEGWDFFSSSDRANFWKVVREQKPDCILMSPECKPFSVIMESNWSRMDPARAKEVQIKGMAMLQFCIQVAEHQLNEGKEFIIEQPQSASSWRTHAMSWLLSQPGVARIVFDQCETGLQVCEKGLSQKSTGIVGNHLGILSQLCQFQCKGDHHHAVLEGGLPHKARVYPAQMVKAIVDGLLLIRPPEPEVTSKNFFDEEEEEGEDMRDVTETDRMPSTPRPGGPKIEKLSPDQLKKIERIHINLGHVSKEQMLLLFRAAGAKDIVMDYVKNRFSCSQCNQQRRPVERRRAALPRTYAFNRQVAVDIFYVSFQGRTLAFLNAICLGTNLQQVIWIKESEGGTPSSKQVWKAFSHMWLRPFGVPESVLCDGGTEFKDVFERGLEQIGTMQIICDAASPWQNGRVERHGGWIKEKAEAELSSGNNFIMSAEDLEEMLIYLVCHKNRWFSRGGFSPYQLVFGVNPSIPSDLLGDQPQDMAWQDLQADPLDQDTAAAEFNRSHRIRQRARELCIQHNAKEKIRLSSSQRCHIQKNWAIGQWVYVWRRAAGSGQGHITRSRWVGPGIVILQTGHTVFVSMRARLWRCNSDQLRAANHYEAVGGELGRVQELQDIIKQGHRSKAGAVDVASEGTPPSEAEIHPLPAGHPEVVQPSSETPEAVEENPSGPTVEVEQPSLPGRGHLLRQILAPVPEEEEVHERRQSVQSSLRTLQEPLEEPDTQTAAQEPLEKKRRTSQDTNSTSSSSSTPRRRPETEVQNTQGRVRRQVLDLEEQERLNRVALRELKRLEREERASQVTRRSSSSNQEENQPEASASSTNPLEEDDTLLSYFELKAEQAEDHQPCFLAKPAKPKNSEFNMKNATDEEKKGFSASDLDEWASISSFGAVEVLSPEESRRVRKEKAERIVGSRMIRRKKPMPGIHQFKYKSRWCVAGHHDPDSGTFKTFSPMPSTEAIAMFFQVALNCMLSLAFADVKSAFCQGNPLDRPQGEIYAEACEGLPVEKGRLIRLVAPVYGLDDAPIRWHRTLLQFFESLGFVPSLLEPCLLIKREQDQIKALVLIEVDDLNLATTEDYGPWLEEQLNNRFVFGKWERQEADFAGRRVRKTEDKIYMNQEKYIVEKLHQIKIPKGKCSDKEELLEPDLFEQYRSMLYKVSWLSHQTRPEACGIVSILSTRLNQASVHDLCCLNKVVAHIKNTASQSLVLHKLRNEDMLFIMASDAGGVAGKPVRQEEPGNPPEDTVQGAWVIFASDKMPSASQKIKVSTLSWRSSKLKRRVSSTLAGEALAFSQGLSEVEWLQIMFRDIVYGDVDRVDWTSSIRPYLTVMRQESLLKGRLAQCAVTDAKSLYDSIFKECPTSRQDRRTSIELAIIIEAIRASQSTVRWTPHPRMVADVLTKDDISKSNGAFEEVLRTGKLSLWDEEQELLRRKNEPTAKLRSKKASAAMRAEAMNLFEVLVNIKFGELSEEDLLTLFSKSIS